MATVTVISKTYGSERINLDNFDSEYASTGSTIFKIVEHIFNDWFEYNTQPCAPLNKDIQFAYYGSCDESAPYSKKGAIREGIEIIIETIKESGRQLITTKDIVKMDVEAAFI